MSATTHTIDHEGKTVEIHEREIDMGSSQFYVEIPDEEEVLVSLTYDQGSGVSFYECSECGNACEHIKMVEEALHGD
ncbi:MAG: hypothetical protein ACYTFG_16615 [Planctomycetota bacterium]|jgi:hypothetical protein